MVAKHYPEDDIAKFYSIVIEEAGFSSWKTPHSRVTHYADDISVDSYFLKSSGIEDLKQELRDEGYQESEGDGPGSTVFTKIYEPYKELEDE